MRQITLQRHLFSSIIKESCLTILDQDYSILGDLKQVKKGPIDGLISDFCWALQCFIIRWYLAALTNVYDHSKYKLHFKTPGCTNPSDYMSASAAFNINCF